MRVFQRLHPLFTKTKYERMHVNSNRFQNNKLIRKSPYEGQDNSVSVSSSNLESNNTNTLLKKITRSISNFNINIPRFSLGSSHVRENSSFSSPPSLIPPLCLYTLSILFLFLFRLPCCCLNLTHHFKTPRKREREKNTSYNIYIYTQRLN